MLELLTMLRPLGKWHVLLAICLFDMAFILVQISNPEFSSAHKRRLQEVLVQQAKVVQSMRETTLHLESIYKAAVGRTETLEQLERGMDDLERQIARLKEHNFAMNATLV